MNHKLLKAGVGYTVGNYLLKGLTFFTIPIFARLLNPDDYGKYSVFASYEAMLFVVLGFAINTSYKNARYKYGTLEEGAISGKDYRSYIATTMVMLVVMLFVWLLLVNLASAFFINILGLDSFSLNMLVLCSFGSMVIGCFNVDVALEYRFQDFLKVAGINAVSSICLSLLLIFTVFEEKRYLGRIVGTVLPVFLLGGCIVYHYLKQARPNNYQEFLSWGIKYSLPIVPHGLSQIVLNQFDRIMINYFVGAFQAGIYSFAYNVFNIISVTANSVDNVWGPWFYEKMHNKEYEVIREKSKFYILFLFSLVSCIMLICPEMIKILGTSDYYDAIYSAIPLIAGGFFAYMYSLPASVEYYYEKTRYIALGTIMAAVINIALNYYVIHKYGYVAVAYTTLLTYLLYFAVHYILAWKIHGNCLFSTKIIILTSLLILIVAAFTMQFINELALRWFVMSVFFVLIVCYIEKKLHLGYQLKRKINWRNEVDQ